MAGIRTRFGCPTGIMIVNHEKLGPEGRSGIRGRAGHLRRIQPCRTQARLQVAHRRQGVHRYDFDGRYAYISPTADGYVGNIVMILDLKDPARPEEVGRWWIPGQWQAVARNTLGNGGFRPAVTIPCGGATGSM